MQRHDYAFPLRIDVASRQAQRSDYERHVMQMIRQVLLTSPGERVNLPEFGCGLRAVVFAPNSDALASSVELLVRQALKRWLSEHIVVRRVEVLEPLTASPDGEQFVLEISYQLVADQSAQTTRITVPR